MGNMANGSSQAMRLVVATVTDGEWDAVRVGVVIPVKVRHMIPNE